VRRAPRPGRAPRAVASADNAAVREARQLERDRVLRDRTGLYLAWGMHLAEEARGAGAEIVRAFIATPEPDEATRRLAADLARGGADVLSVRPALLESIAKGSGDQGILFVVRRPRTTLAALLEGRPTLLLAAHGVQDPGNVGTMARSALVLGAAGLLTLEGTADPHSSRAVRAGMGAHFRLPIASAASRESVAALRAAGLAIVAADPSGDAGPAAARLDRPVAICVGSEGGGLPPALLESADVRVRIPMARGVSSLNVHAAAAILLYEAARQRGFEGLL
jgi:RNA methyltransferase, TrmH family